MSWFRIVKLTSNIILIQERLDLIEPRFRTTYTNMYLLLGETTNVLIDTGSGVQALRPVLKELLGSIDKDLLVFNTHHHFDHVLGNEEFPTAYIHYYDYPFIAKPLDLSFLATSKTRLAQEILKKHGVKKRLTTTYHILYGDEEFKLGENYFLKVLHTPGHTPGSISLLTSKGELFTGDTIHHGAIYVSNKSLRKQWLQTLSIMTQIQQYYTSFIQKPQIKLFSGHETTPLPFSTIHQLYKVMNEAQEQFNTHTAKELEYDDFLQAYVIDKHPFHLIFEQESPTN